MTAPGFDAAVSAWRDVLGAAWVTTSPDDLAVAGLCTLPGAPRPAAVLVPADPDQVAECLRIAQAHRVRVHPVSTGRNWGYGSGCPPQEGTAVLRLSRLDAVVDFDDELGLVTVRPGVTFGGLAAFLRLREARWWPPAVGAGPGTSVVGTALQRGIGQGPYRDLASHLVRLDVLRPDGTSLRLAAGTPGPDPSGLFLQGGPGVVTSATFRLHPEPVVRQRVAFRVEDAPALSAVVDEARTMLQRNAGLAVDVVNRARVHAQAPRASALPEVLAGQWSGHVELWADDEEALGLSVERVLRRIGPHCGCRVPGPVERGSDPAAGLGGLECAYQAKSTGPGTDPDPDRDGCGVWWFAPTLFMRGADVVSAVGLIDGICAAEGFAPCVSLRLGPTTLHCVIGLFWDRGVPGEDARAARCHDRLVSACAGAGLFTYRPVLGRIPAGAVDSGAQRLLDEVWAAVDPHAVLGSHQR